MIGSDFLRFVAQSVLAGLLVRGTAPLAAIACLAACIGAGAAFFYPARGGLIAQIVRKDQLGRANSSVSGGASLAAILGPALAGLIVTRVGPGWAIGLDGVTYAVSAACLSAVRMPARTVAASSPQSPFEELKLGLHAFAEQRWLSLMVGQFGLLKLVALAPFMVLAPVLLARSPHGAQLWGSLLSAIGVGGLVGAVGLVWWQPRRAVIAIQAGVVLLVRPLALLAAGASFPTLLIGGVLYGAGVAW